MANLDYNDFRPCDCVWRMVLPANSLKLLDGGMAPSYSGHPAGAAGGSGVDFQRPLHCRVSGFVQSCAAPNCQSSVRACPHKRGHWPNVRSWGEPDTPGWRAIRDCTDREDRAQNRRAQHAEPASAAVGKLGLILTNLQWEARVGAGVVCPNAALKS